MIAPKPIKSQIIQSPPSTVVTEAKFESSFSEIENPSESFEPVVVPPPVPEHKIPLKHPISHVAGPQPVIASTTMKSIDLFGAIPFQSAAVGPTNQVPATQLATNQIATNHPLDTTQQPIKIAPPLQIITLKPINHQSTILPPTSSSQVGLVLKHVPKSIPQPTVSLVSSSMVPPQSTAQLSKPAIIQAKPSLVTPIVATPLNQSSLAPIGAVSPKNVALQKSNSKLKSKVAKKYEVDESDDDVDGLLDPNEDESENILDLEKASKDSKKKDKKKDKKVCLN